MGRMQRDKGKRGEREAAQALRQALGIEARRSVQYQAREDAADLALPDLPGLWVEVKRTNRLALWQVLDEAVRQAGQRVPLILHRADRRPWVAIVPLDALARLVHALARLRDNGGSEVDVC